MCASAAVLRLQQPGSHRHGAIQTAVALPDRVPVTSLLADGRVLVGSAAAEAHLPGDPQPVEGLGRTGLGWSTQRQCRWHLRRSTGHSGPSSAAQWHCWGPLGQSESFRYISLSICFRTISFWRVAFTLNGNFKGGFSPSLIVCFFLNSGQSMMRSIGSHSGSQHSSTGPSNNTGSTNLSGTSVHPIGGGNWHLSCTVPSLRTAKNVV